jgi:hypothetical protein
MAQLRLSYQEFQKRDTEVLQITCSTAQEAQLYFRQYSLDFPYLCDPERAVYSLYGIPIVQGNARMLLTNIAAKVQDTLFHGEKTPSPIPYMKRYGSSIPEQALLIVDKLGIIRYVHTTGPIGSLPSNAEYFRQLDKLQ